MFSLPFLLRRSPVPARIPRVPAAPDGEAVAEPLLGPGWFDSSWDLRRGLDVREGLPANASVNEWLTVRLTELS